MFWHHDETSQPSSSSAAAITASQGTRDTSLISDAGLWCGSARMSTIQTRPASVSSISSHWASAISRHHPVTLARGGSP
jgi:hypothetical protein